MWTVVILCCPQGDDDVTRFWASLGGSFGRGQSAEWQGSPAPGLRVLAGSLAKLEEQDDEDDDDEEEDDTAGSDGSKKSRFRAKNPFYWTGTVILISRAWEEKRTDVMNGAQSFLFFIVKYRRGWC